MAIYEIARRSVSAVQKVIETVSKTNPERRRVNDIKIEHSLQSGTPTG